MPGRVRTRAGLAGTLVLLAATACAPVTEFDDLHSFMAGVKSRPGAMLPPLPGFQSGPAFVYQAGGLRSPFALTAAASVSDNAVALQPDPERPRQILEKHALAELKLVGTLVRHGSGQALIQDGVGQVHRVGVNDYLGMNHGRIVDVSASALTFVEIVPAGAGGWVERPRTLSLP